jgi:hypothetical protein
MQCHCCFQDATKDSKQMAARPRCMQCVAIDISHCLAPLKMPHSSFLYPTPAGWLASVFSLGLERFVDLGVEHLHWKPVTRDEIVSPCVPIVPLARRPHRRH